jgi:hypothetical protein
VAVAVAAVVAAVAVAAAEIVAIVGKLSFMPSAGDPQLFWGRRRARGVVPETNENGVHAAGPQGDVYVRGG